MPNIEDDIPDGMIILDNDTAELFGFTSENFDSCSYLWKRENNIYVSLIVSKRKGNFRQLVQAINIHGFNVVIPNPLPYMESLCEKYGFEKGFEHDPIFGSVVTYTSKTTD